MLMKKTLLAVLALVLPLLAQSSFADDPWQHRDEHHWEEPHRDAPWGPGPGPHYRPDHHPGWHGDIRRFHERDMMLWNSGHWQRARHNGRIGWWWVVGPSWYFYPAPIYPVPDPYRPPMVEGPAGPPQPVWYYCDRPAGYYPYVAECRHWQVVPAQ
jgi:hypothetical protein